MPGHSGLQLLEEDSFRIMTIADSQAHPRPGGPIRFALFDWLDNTGRGLDQGYEERLKVLELADRSGFYAYHLAEHHGTNLSTVPSPNLFLASVAQRTKQIRLGPLGLVLPLYNPLRLFEEICMLDNLSHGRLEIGIGRGVSEFEFRPFGVPLEDSRAIFKEVLDILLMGFTTGKLNYHGKYFQYEDVTTLFTPFQKPYPPLWYPTSNPDSIPWAAAQGISTVLSSHFVAEFSRIASLLQTYADEYEKHRGDEGRLNGHVRQAHYGFSSHIHLAETDAVARKQAKAGYEDFHKNFVHLRMRPEDVKRYEALAFDNLASNGRFLVGSPATVRDQLASFFEESGANYFLGNFTFGSLPLDETLHSVELFANEVMPAFTDKELLTQRH